MESHARKLQIIVTADLLLNREARLSSEILNVMKSLSSSRFFHLDAALKWLLVK